MLLAPLAQVLRDFHSLCHLDFSLTSVDGVRGMRVETDELILCNAWSDACPSLQHSSRGLGHLKQPTQPIVLANLTTFLLFLKEIDSNLGTRLHVFGVIPFTEKFAD